MLCNCSLYKNESSESLIHATRSEARTDEVDSRRTNHSFRNLLCCLKGNDTDANQPGDTNDVVNRSVNNPWVKDGKLYNQDYGKLKQSCLSNHCLYEDPKFPPNDKSLYYSRYPPGKFEWKRASQISNNPKFFEDGASRFDVNQGSLGDCWMLAAVAAVAMDKPLLYKVVPKTQSFSEDDYAGIFHFKFWQYGVWVDVVIDDYLPTRSGSLVFMHSDSRNEFWPALLEKAYAKLYGSYEALEGGMTGECLDDLTGGCTELYDLKGENCPRNLFELMKKASTQHCLQGCSIVPDPRVREARMENGLVMGHAYTITKVLEVNVNHPNFKGKLPLIRIRNPWGQKEWKGAWSDSSPEWGYISEKEKREIGLTIDDDGEFWMDERDFRKYWHTLEICNILTDPENDTTRHNRLAWNVSSITGSWKRGKTAGGCINNIKLFALNPQYRFRLDHPDDSNDDNHGCTIVISLMQRDRRALRDDGLDSLSIGFQIYALWPDPDKFPKRLKPDFFRRRRPVGGSDTYIALREVTARCTIPPGTYCIIPSTFHPKEDGDFFLRIFTHEKTNILSF